MSADLSFGDGGVWMYIILVWGVALYSGVVVQFVQSRRRDFSQALWGGVIALVLIGVLGTVIGFIQGLNVVAQLPREQVATSTIQVASIAALPTAFAALIAVPCATLVGVASAIARRYARGRQPA